MKKSKNQFYVVWKGHQPGIYDSWDNCKKQVQGFTDAIYKAFASGEEARNAFIGNPMDYILKKREIKTKLIARNNKIRSFDECLCVDAACSGNPGVLEYRGVHMPSQKEVFRRGPFPEGTTNIGEFLAIVTGLAWLKQQNRTIPLYSDSNTGMIWAKNKRINTKLIRNDKNEELFQVIDKALEWLNINSYPNKVIKWETSAWGEIPADFGRK